MAVSGPTGFASGGGGGGTWIGAGRTAAGFPGRSIGRVDGAGHNTPARSTAAIASDKESLR